MQYLNKFISQDIDYTADNSQTWDQITNTWGYDKLDVIKHSKEEMKVAL